MNSTSQYVRSINQSHEALINANKSHQALMNATSQYVRSVNKSHAALINATKAVKSANSKLGITVTTFSEEQEHLIPAMQGETLSACAHALDALKHVLALSECSLHPSQQP